MNYPFYCPNCEYSEIISMPIKEYVCTGYLCSKCNTEMEREVNSLVCGMSIDQTGDFFRRAN